MESINSNLEVSNILKNIRAHYEFRRISPVLESKMYPKANCLFVEMASAICGKDYDTTYTAEIINRLVRWVYNSPIDGIDCNKGFLLRGETGRGKTLLMYALKEFLQYEAHRYEVGGKRYRIDLEIVSARNIAREYAQQSEESIINKYSYRVPCLCIDDLGSEPMLTSNYGNKCSVVSEILANREQGRLLTFATTNLPSLGEFYDDRILSRMHTLFNSQTLSHKTDYRTL